MPPSLRTKKFEATHWLSALALCAFTLQGQAQAIYLCGSDTTTTANCEQPTTLQGSSTTHPHKKQSKAASPYFTAQGNAPATAGKKAAKKPQ